MNDKEKIISKSPNIINWFLLIETIFILILAIIILRIVNDDAFITLRYARNLIHRLGFVYNPGERVLGITNPLLALLQVFFSLPVLGNVLLGNYILQYALLFGCVILANYYFRDKIMMASLIPLLFFNQQTVGYLGNEIILVLFLSLLALICMDTNKDKLFAFCLSFLYLARFDGFIFGIIATCWWLYHRRPISIKKISIHLVIWASLPILWHLFAYFYYGHFLSNSVTSKILGSENVKTYITVLFEKHLPALLFGSGNLLNAILIITGLIIFWNRSGIYLLWFISFSIVYWIINAPGITVWYFHTLTFVAIFGFAGGVSYLARKIFSEICNLNTPNPSQEGNFSDKLTVFVFAAFISLFFIAGQMDYPWEKQRYDLYKLVAQEIKKSAEPQTYIEMNEIGILGYYLNNPVLDHHFLVTPQGRGKNRFPQIDQLRELYKPQFIIINPYRELSQDELNIYKGYSCIGSATSGDKSIRVYIFQRNNQIKM